MIKILIFLTTILVSYQFNISEQLVNQGYQKKSLYTGFQEFTKKHEDYIDTILVNGFSKSIFEDFSLHSELFNKILKFTKEDQDNLLIQCSKGKKGDFLKFLSQHVGTIGRNGNEKILLESHQDDCFEQIEVEYQQINSKTVQLTFKSGKNKEKGNKCSDTFTIASLENYHVLVIGEENQTYKWTLKNLSEKQINSILTFGLNIFRTCDSFANIVPDLIITVGLFFGGFSSNPYIPLFGSKPAFWQEILNPIFIKHGTGYQWERRNDVFVDLDETEVKPGDLLIITRMDGLDQIIQLGTGSRSGHSVTLLEIDGEMYAVESQDAWYWPKRNIQRNKWSDWKKYAKNAGFNVALLPLREEIRAKFNNKAASEWFKKVEGLPYGYHNFLFGWIDTEKESLPAILDINFLYSVFSLLEKFLPKLVNTFLGEALNQRLKTKDLNLGEIYTVMSQRNITLSQLFSMPEQDSWIYSDGQSMVCSSFVAAVWKAGGIFENLEINATEFTPRDIYQTNFFDLNYKKPAKCLNDGLPYCQIMGKFKMDITSDGYSTIDPYSHMNEKCPSVPPLYSRTKGC
ncbi:hypothetical protein IMG5_188030 [Ichthyophthirius multifiliis]|uniref:Uncharacterized protein n=1 Tax=Ichthyophthirius multifiliis TaxID=5932 RepID=G0R3X3_ICHMU|nr:hypothetical protein IMG5_188030 [Ichthyophthirius multifiliis]EGR27832.1 hypothetical protein IMG5_188030 [Ichthyophthirius multifiliis]|eukprot:XP_004027177.1 hypothetical protein IMG5_188030 [Ichthyophthirius multifiliis]